MANSYFQASSIPQTNSQGSSAAIRGEFSRIALGFDKLPTLSGNPNKLVRINSTGSAMQDSRLTDDGTTAAVAGDAIITATATQTITGKTMAWANNTWVGFNSAATKVAGTGADNVLLLSVANKLPALDGSLLTNLTLAQLSGTLPVSQGGTGASTASGARSNLGLGSIATQDSSSVAITGGSIAGISDLAVADGGTGASTASGARTNLGLGSIATQDSSSVSITGGSIAGITDLAVVDGGTGASTASGARSNLGAAASGANSDITSLSGLTTALSIGQGGTGATTLGGAQTALGINLKANANNAVLTGAPVAPSPAIGDNSQRIATTYYVNQTVAAVGGMAPSNDTPLINGVATPGVGTNASRSDHVHPVDTSRAAAGANSDITSLSGLTTALSVAQGGTGSTTASGARTNLGLVIGTDVLAPTGVKTVGGSSLLGSGDVTALSGLVLTGATLNASPAQNDNSLKVASTAYVDTAIAQSPVGMLPSDDVPLMDGVAAAGTSVTGARSDHKHPVDTSRASAAQGAKADTALQPSTGVEKSSSTGAAHMPAGTTAQRDPAPQVGDQRFNTTISEQEVWNGSSWVTKLDITGTGKRITGDFSNATVANRVMFQTSTVDSPTTLGVLPNGTSLISALSAFASSDPTNTSSMRLLSTSIDGRLDASRAGTGTYLPMTFYTGGSERMRITTGGSVGIGTTNPQATLNVFGPGANMIVSNTSGTANDSHAFTLGTYSAATTPYWSSITANASSFKFKTYNTDRLLIDANGLVTVVCPAGLGYGTGAGGTVTQATSKSTAVTLNKPTGQITMHNASLAAGATNGFIFNNSLLGPDDVVVVTQARSGTYGAYTVWVDQVQTGNCAINVTNRTGGSLSEAVVINFAIIKGSAS